jgi:hypothetical protein
MVNAESQDVATGTLSALIRLEGRWCAFLEAYAPRQAEDGYVSRRSLTEVIKINQAMSVADTSIAPVYPQPRFKDGLDPNPYYQESRSGG